MNSVKYSGTGRFVDLVSENAITGRKINYPAMSINQQGGYIDLTFEKFECIVSHSAKFFYQHFSNIDFLKFRNVGFLSHSDSLYLFNMLGLMKVNVAPVLISPRNSLEATIHLLKESSSQALIYQEMFNDWAVEIKKQIPSILLIPRWAADISQSFSLQEYNLVRPLDTIEEELQNVSYILHSSGSTSYPKLVPQRNFTIHNSGHRFGLEATDPARKELNFFPLFHAAGVLTMVVSHIYEMKSVILSPDMSPGNHYSSKMILQLIKQLSPKILWILPLMAKELIEHCNNIPKPHGWDVLKLIECIKYGGAQLPSMMIHDLFDHGITPCSMFGLTEAGMILKCYPDKNSKFLVPFTPFEHLKYKFKDLGDDIGELIILGNDPCLADVKDLDEEGNYPTKDLFQIVGQNPIKLNYVSRADDTIVH
ncbi:acetyl-CoA synthetase-like protein, partial [Conidiobolus coronatus NRRL 28638]